MFYLNCLHKDQARCIEAMRGSGLSMCLILALAAIGVLASNQSVDMIGVLIVWVATFLGFSAGVMTAHGMADSCTHISGPKRQTPATVGNEIQVGPGGTMVKMVPVGFAVSTQDILAMIVIGAGLGVAGYPPILEEAGIGVQSAKLISTVFITAGFISLMFPYVYPRLGFSCYPQEPKGK